MSDFIHLHTHSHYSLQDAACTIDSLVRSAVRDNMKAIALTDHGAMYGISEFNKLAKKAGIKPIFGIEAYITKSGSRLDRGEDYIAAGKARTKLYYHIILLAKNNFAVI